MTGQSALHVLGERRYRVTAQVENALGYIEHGLGKYDKARLHYQSALYVDPELIEARYPEHGILGEEFGAKMGRGYRWVLDPVDGTRAFITNCFLFGTLIALERDDGAFSVRRIRNQGSLESEEFEQLRQEELAAKEREEHAPTFMAPPRPLVEYRVHVKDDEIHVSRA